jgi:hypothetical protein
LEGIVLLPPQATFISESSFSRVKICAIKNKEEVSDVGPKPETKQQHTPVSSSYINTQSTSLAAASVPVNS